MGQQEQLTIAREYLDVTTDLSVGLYRDKTLEKFTAMEENGFEYEPLNRQFVNRRLGFVFGQPLVETAFGAFLDVSGFNEGTLSLHAFRGILSAVADFAAARERIAIAEHLGVPVSQIEELIQPAGLETDG